MTKKISRIMNLSRADKIMLVMLELSGGSGKKMKYEDIVVEAFKHFPEDFRLRGYPEYPDSGDLVHKPLYDFRKKGFIEASNKVFSLTERGLTQARSLGKFTEGSEINETSRLSRFAEKEILRVEKSEGYKLYIEGAREQLTDSDLFNYLGVSPRTTRNEFLGRYSVINDAISELQGMKQIPEKRKRIIEYHQYLTAERFIDIIKHFIS